MTRSFVFTVNSDLHLIKEVARTALDKKSLWACVRGLLRGAGLEAASGPDLGTLEGCSVCSWARQRVVLEKDLLAAIACIRD